MGQGRGHLSLVHPLGLHIHIATLTCISNPSSADRFLPALVHGAGEGSSLLSTPTGPTHTYSNTNLHLQPELCRSFLASLGPWGRVGVIFPHPSTGPTHIATQTCISNPSSAERFLPALVHGAGEGSFFLIPPQGLHTYSNTNLHLQPQLCRPFLSSLGPWGRGGVISPHQVPPHQEPGLPLLWPVFSNLEFSMETVSTSGKCIYCTIRNVSNFEFFRLEKYCREFYHHKSARKCHDISLTFYLYRFSP